MNVKFLIVVLTLSAVIISSLGVVYTRHESRRFAVQLGEFENRRDELIEEWSRLQLEQAWMAEAGQVETKARESLGMNVPDHTKILLVKP